MPINTETYSRTLRAQAVRTSEKQVLIARLAGSEQEKDLTSPVNCGGYGRIRHFKLYRYEDWSPNPLPILPAAKALGKSPDVHLRAQVFQNAACNWRCWYCYVDNNRLSADLRFAEYFTADSLMESFLNEPDRAQVIDLSGGQPDLVPEWVLWMMESLEQRNLEKVTFLWSDDNLSNRYFWEHLTANQRSKIASFPNYARVACFKGFDKASFAFNTLAESSLFEEQFLIFRDLLREGIDLYGYVTFTTPPNDNIRSAIAHFVDRLQQIHTMLPLRIVPLKVDVFSPTRSRVRDRHKEALRLQYEVHNAWIEEINSRFTEHDRHLSITEIPISAK